LEFLEPDLLEQRQFIVQAEVGIIILDLDRF
jgi:hypothetical protein